MRISHHKRAAPAAGRRPHPLPRPPRAASADAASAPPTAATPPSPPGGEGGGELRQRLTLHTAAEARPHPDKAHYGGEDAYFLSSAAVGVADGVGGWADSGVNPAWYARTLMRLARAAVEGAVPVAVVTPADVGVCPPTPAGGPAPPPPAAPTAAAAAETPAAEYGEDGGVAPPPPSPPRTPPPPADAPLAALTAAHAATRLPGSATACIVALDPSTSTLHGAVVGDAGAMVVRGGEPVFRSAGKSHGFDFPHQLAAAPDHAPETDTVDEAVRFAVPVAPGDVVIVASDGFFDNVWPAEAAALCPPSASSTVAAADLASALVSLAATNAADADYPSPYAADAAAAGVVLGGVEPTPAARFGAFVASELGQPVAAADPVGGKQDDITVVVGVVREG